MARSVDDILRELDASYSPQRQALQTRIDALPAQADAEIGGLKAQEQDYFDNTIMADARNRGIAFGGIPIGERARYGASTFLPAVARVRTAQNETKQSLFDALNNVNLDQRKTAMGIQQQELDRDAAAREAAAMRSAQSSIYSGLFDGLRTPQSAPQVQGAAGAADPSLKVKATNAVSSLLNTNNRGLIQRTFEAIRKSANNGNPYDKLKLQLLLAARPDWFTSKLSSGVPSKGSPLPQLSNPNQNIASPAFNLINRLGR
ncbi:MAG TPA: hypothetical protein VJ836_00810 [Candidatus Saccharimonadales bacterium]|nr:hypothetical protein [Candidatus Saccharimonadales bacterium]